LSTGHSMNPSEVSLFKMLSKHSSHKVCLHWGNTLGILLAPKGYEQTGQEIISLDIEYYVLLIWNNKNLFQYFIDYLNINIQY
jgi:hypothetical protein